MTMGAAHTWSVRRAKPDRGDSEAYDHLRYLCLNSFTPGAVRVSLETPRLHSVGVRLMHTEP